MSWKFWRVWGVYGLVDTGVSSMNCELWGFVL